MRATAKRLLQALKYFFGNWFIEIGEVSSYSIAGRYDSDERLGMYCIENVAFFVD